MIEAIYIGMIGGGIFGAGRGIAAVITAYYRGRATLLRAKRGDPELPLERTTLPALLLRRDPN